MEQPLVVETYNVSAVMSHWHHHRTTKDLV